MSWFVDVLRFGATGGVQLYHAGSEAYAVHQQMERGETGSAAERATLVVRILHVTASLAEFGGGYGGRQVAVGTRIAAGASGIAVRGARIALLKERGLATNGELATLVHVTVHETLRTTECINRHYEGFGLQVASRLPRLFPKQLLEELEAEGVDLQEVTEEIQKILSDRIMTAIALNQAVAAPWKEYIRAWRGGYHALTGNREAPESEPEAVARARTARQMAAHYGLQVALLERLFEVRCRRSPAMRAFICPLTQHPIQEPIRVGIGDWIHLFEEEPLRSRLQREGSVTVIHQEVLREIRITHLETVEPADPVRTQLQQHKQEILQEVERDLN